MKGLDFLAGTGTDRVHGSTLLRVGAILTAVSALATLGFGLAEVQNPGPTQHYLPWFVWILALWSSAAGFLWVGSTPTLTRLGWVAAGLHFLHGTVLLLVLLTSLTWIVSPAVLSGSRIASVVLFAVFERRHLGTFAAAFLGATAAVLLVKVALRVLGPLAEVPYTAGLALDAVPLLAYAAALFLGGRALKSAEGDWWVDHPHDKPMDLADFNNPEHPWNKDGSKANN